MKKAGSIVKQLFVILFWIGVWAVLAALVDQALLLPSPASVFLRLLELAGEKSFWITAGVSIFRITLGILCAIVLGCVLAVLTCRFSLLDALLSPLLTVIKSTPVASFILLLLIWIGRDQVPAVISGLMVLPVIWNNICAGVRGTDRNLLEMAEMYRLSPFGVLRRIYIPSVMPHFLSAIRSSIGIGWKAGVAAEVLTVPVHAIGRMIYESKLYWETVDLFAWTVVVVLISLFIEKIVISALNRLGKSTEERMVGGGD